ncbi:unnamed protein product [Linum tenue]|uniref:RNase H type-1 domain-containing protein n=1 Tax=Linum tenue TaxID=586396 RepID=A0AAV0RWM7_9ROSI|nr:unnamed protein product [Linum tenue]CAI0618726.1 unnamed protein product [Linum tenue]CAI0619380.1 unnamed protein product [Linum tenue]
MDKDRLVLSPSLPIRTEVEISWKPPPLEWVTLNSDGSVLPDSCHEAAGGLIRVHTGRCTAAFALNLGICSITLAELRGVVEGLQLAWDNGHRSVHMELDSRCAIQLLRSCEAMNHHEAAIIGRFQDLLSRD